MTSQYTSAVTLEGIPHVAIEVVVTGEKETARLGEGDGGDSTDNGFMTEFDEDFNIG